MAFEEMIKKALDESRNNCRLGDTLEEVREIQNYIKNAEKIYIPNKNGIKVDVLNKVLREYNLPSAKILQINTNEADSNRSPAFAKAIMALDVCDADLIIARGRLGLPGSGSLLLFVDNKGRILTCGTSPSHAISQKTLEDAVYEEANEVFTIKSETKLIDIFNNIINKKSEACLNYIDSLNLDKNTKIVVVGTYFTGVGIVKKLRKKYNNILLIDIYPHLKELLDTDIGGDYKKSIEFSTSLELINSGDVVIDTTGFGGLTVEQSSEINAEVFLIEDPVAEDNDRLLKDKNNIHKRINAVNAPNKAILKTKGIDTKTSGTMTLTIGVLTNALHESQKMEGVLYSACEMGFFEEVIFKKKDIPKFINLINAKAMKISTINPFSCDDLIKTQLDKIESKMI